MAGCLPPGAKRRVFKDAGRVCPVDYRIAADAFSGEPDMSCDVLYVVGGLYGNPFALDAVDKLVAQEQGNVQVVLNGDMHWFDKTAQNFAVIEDHACRYTPLVGNVEAELRRQTDVGVGCGCAYPNCTSDESVSRSNHIHKGLSKVIHANPQLQKLLDGRPATLVVSVNGCRVGITHGDEKLIGGWDCSRESLQSIQRQDELDTFFETNGIDVLATTHTCATAVMSLPHGIIANNGAAGLPNFAGQHFGLAVRIAPDPYKGALLSAYKNGVYTEVVPVEYDHDAYIRWFDDLWSPTSPAAISYRSRIVNGPSDYVSLANLGGFSLGECKVSGLHPSGASATKEDVSLALASLVYFEDRIDDPKNLRTADKIHTIQANITAQCNLSCSHCHVESSPQRTEKMSHQTLVDILKVACDREITTIDITGGAPEMHPEFEWFLREAAQTVEHVMVRSNIVILQAPGFAHLLDVYAELGVEVVASFPSVFTAQEELQRGKDTFGPLVEGLKQLANRGYGSDGKHILDVVFNPQWPILPEDQETLEQIYKARLEQLGVPFDNLFAVANCPIGRYGMHLLDTGEFDEYLNLLQDTFNQDACSSLMCRHQMSVGWDGRIYDCDFNQPLGLVSSLDGEELTIERYALDSALSLERSIVFGGHCYACTAGQGSSCGGTLVQG